MRTSKLYILVMLSLASILLASCSGGSSVKPSEETTVLPFEDAVMQYLGDYSYTDTEAAFVYEKIEDETDDQGNPFYGILYREIKDLPGVLHQKDFPVLI